MLRYIRYATECIAAIIGVGIVLSLLAVWRLSSSPISSDFMTPYIESGIEGIVPGSNAHVEKSVLSWGGLERSVSLHAENIVVNDSHGTEIANIPTLDATVSIIGLILGRFTAKELVIDRPIIDLTRAKDGAFGFGGMDLGNGSHDDKQSEETASILRNVAEELSHSRLLDKLAVRGATFNVHDIVTHKDWSVGLSEVALSRKILSELNGKLRLGALEGHVTFEISQNEEKASIQIEYAYDPQKHEHLFSTTFDGVTPAYIAGGHPESLGLDAATIANLPLTGNVQIALAEDFNIQRADADVRGGSGSISYPEYWDQPIKIKSFEAKTSFDRSKEHSALLSGILDLEGPSVELNAEGQRSHTSGKDLDFFTSLKIDNMPMSLYAALWPKTILPAARDWLEANLRNGSFPHAEIAMTGNFAWDDLVHASLLSGSGKISAVNGRVTYMDGMPPVENVAANATFDLQKMNVEVSSGNISNIQIVPFTLSISGLSEEDQTLDLPLRIAGPIPGVLHLIDLPPLGYAKQVGINPDDMTGQIEGVVHFKFPLEKTLELSDVSIQAEATATDVASSKIVPNLAIDQGSLALNLDVTGFNLDGHVSLNKIPAEVSWRENFNEQPNRPLRKAAFTATIKDDQWKNLGISALEATTGSVPVAIEMTKLTKNKTIFTGSIDMSAAALDIPMLDWKKAANVPALAKFIAEAPAGKPVAVTSLSFKGPQFGAEGSASLSADMSQVLSVNLSKIVLGRTSTALRFTQTFGSDGILRFDATGASIDISGLRGGNEPKQADSRPKEYHIQVGRLYTGDASEIANAEGFAVRDQLGWSSINLEGIAEGNTPLSMSLTPESDGRRTLKISCDNFGNAMKGLGFTDTVKGGKVSVTGESSIDAPRIIVGHAKIDDFTVERLPALALLLNATSPFGFSGILTDSASFSHFEGDFTLEGDELTLTRAHAAGSAIGINIDGKIDMNTGESALQGTLVPFSTVNNILNYIPIVGGLITGGDNQGVLAVTYHLDGPLDAPKVRVNPVSLLTPGFIRNLFFRDPLTSETN